MAFKKRLILTAALFFTHLSASMAEEKNPFDKYAAWPNWQANEKIVNAALGSAPRAPRSATEKERLMTELSSPLQTLGTSRSWLGDTTGAIEAFDIQHSLFADQDKSGQTFPDDAMRLRAASAVNAISAIVKEARDRQIVILNEGHNMPMHRAFAAALARELRKIGYEYLACETFGPAPLALPYINRKTGYYSNEPVFANFLREAQKDHWRLVPYEEEHVDHRSPNAFSLREREQAENLNQRIFLKDPKAKVFIYVGYGHNLKKPVMVDGEEDARMAANLWRLTGIEPLTIDQTTMYAHPAEVDEFPLYRAILTKAASQEPFMLVSPSGSHEVFGPYRNRMDMQVIFPSYTNDVATLRPSWLSSLAHLRPYEIPAAMLPTKARRVIYAHLDGDGPTAVPADAIVLAPGAPTPKLMVPSNDVTLSYED